jgi:predicted PurR-regulated permease PerM
MPNPEHQEGSWYERLTRGAPLAVLVAAALLVAYKLLPVIELVAVAMLVALVLRTAVRTMEKAGVPSWLAVTALVAGVGALAVLIWLVVVPNLVRETRILASAVPGYANAWVELADRVTFIPDRSQLVNRIQGLFSQLAGMLPSLATLAARLTGAIVAVLFLALYMSVNPDPVVSGALRLVPREKRKRAEELIRTMEVRLRGWMIGTAIVSLFVGGGGAVGLWFLGVPLPVTFGLIAGILNIVPYLGSIVGSLLPALVALTISPFKALLVLLLFAALNQVDGNLLRPLVMGRVVRLQPATMLISLLVLGSLLGVVGLLLAVPAAVVVATLIDELSPEEPQRVEGADPS